MAVNSRASGEIDRPIDVVFRFYADEHHKNHPRWDPDIELWLDTDDPIGVGTTIRRRNSRSGSPVDGTMEVVEFARDESITFLIHDGPMEMRGGATFEARGPKRTALTIWADIPAMDDAMQEPITQAMERSIRNIKQLIDADT